ncbi:MAG: alpha/beta hydrolase [Nocardioidaceae bacterium]
MRRAAALLAGLAALLAAAPAHAALRFERCEANGFECARLSVPLDRGGAVPGQVSLLVKRLRAARGPALGATVALAGGPGQSATEAFDDDSLGLLSGAYARRDLIVFDQRGTGGSGLLRCQRLERSNLLDAGRAAGDCALRLGPRRALYTTRESVEDIEALRRELGVARVALFGVSYGTKVALAYAQRYPDHVERLVLDSVVEPGGPDPLYLDTMRALPRALRGLCRAGCGRFTRWPVRDLERLVARLARGPLHGRVVDPRGRPRRARLSRADLFAILLAGDFDPPLRAEVPGTVLAALRGDTAPLLRLKRRAIELEGKPPAPRVLSAALYAATTCEEAPLPWARTAPFAERPGQAGHFAAALPSSAFRPFDRLTALDSDTLRLCSRWPAAAAAPAIGGGPLPDVPVLLLEGDDDLRTPVEGARRVASLFARAHLLVAPATGHSVLGTDTSACAQRAFTLFFAGAPLPRRCPAVRRGFPPVVPPPTRLRQLRPAPGASGLRGRTVAAVALTLRDVFADSLTGLFVESDGNGVPRGGGLRGGSYRLSIFGVLRLERLQYLPGVTVSGTLRDFGGRRPRGSLRIGGRAAPHGTLLVRGSRVRGRLAGRSVSARLELVPATLLAARARAARLAPLR